MSMQRYDGVVIDENGNAVSGASVTVKVKATGANATIYSDEGVTPISNPITTGSDGTYWFYAADDRYTVTAAYGSDTHTLGDVLLHSQESVHLCKPDSTELVNNDTTLQDDDDLTFTVRANQEWVFRLVLKIDSDPLADFKFAFDTDMGATLWYIYRLYPKAGALAFGDGTLGSTPDVATTGNLDVLVIEGYVKPGDAGSFTLQWTQNAAHASDTKVEMGSSLVALQVR